MRSGGDELISAELRRLPALAAPAGGWERIVQRLQAPLPRHGRWFGPVSALAASVCLMAVALAWLAARVPGGNGRGTVATVSTDIDQLVQHSQQLEAALQRLPERPAVQRASTAAVIDELQSRIQLLDAQLDDSSAPAPDTSQQQSMWSERVRLLNSLVDVRYAEALRNSHLPVPPTGEFL
jgi:septal ring factor EnvC (AmiA/AmiB activator)